MIINGWLWNFTFQSHSLYNFRGVSASFTFFHVALEKFNGSLNSVYLWNLIILSIMKFYFDMPYCRPFNVLSCALVSLFNLATYVLQFFEFFGIISS